MKTVDYINILIKEKENLTALCKSHAETIRLLKRELGKLNDNILKKDKKIQKLENDISNINPQIDLNEFENVKNELDILKEKYADLQSMYNEVVQKNVSNSKTNKNKNELNKLKSEYNDLKRKYEDVVHRNEEFMRIFDEMENEIDSN
jgi:chromosome segregation ATPase